MFELSNASNNIFGQPMFQVLSRIKEKEREGIDVVHFEIGDPDFDSPPEVIDEGCMCLRNGDTHYTASIGDYNLRNEIRNFNNKVRGFMPNIDQVMIASGANPLFFLCGGMCG